MWMLALAAAWLQAADADPQGPEMSRVDAWAGRLRQPAGNAANDMAAPLLILVLFWWLACAKYCAKLPGQSAVSCKLTTGRFHPAILPESACLLLFPVSALILALCQNDHLPTPPEIDPEF